jgi:hypothetical protein
MMLSGLSRLAIRGLHPQGSPQRCRKPFAPASRAPFSYREHTLRQPARGSRAFHQISPSREKTLEAHQAGCELEPLLHQFRQAATNQERLARQLARETTSLLGDIYLGQREEDPGQEKLKALIVARFRRLDPKSISCLRQALLQANFSVKLVKSEIDDVMLLDYGFANGPPHRKSTTELDTDDIYRLLDQAAQDNSVPEDL